MFGLFQSRCQVCGSHFNRTKYKWQIRGQKALVCPTCNTALQKRVSAAAFGKNVEFPEIRKPDGCGLLGCLVKLALLFVALAIASAIFSNRTSNTGESVLSPVPLQTTEQRKPLHSKVPLFNRPSDAVKSPLELGLSDTANGKPAWRTSEQGWYGLAKIVTHKGSFSKEGDVDNDITCMHSSQSAERIDYVRWTANHFNPVDTSTPAKFKELCLSYTRKLGIVTPSSLFEGVDPSKGQLFETEHAVFKLERLSYKIGYGWQFTVTGKTESER